MMFDPFQREPTDNPKRLDLLLESSKRSKRRAHSDSQPRNHSLASFMQEHFSTVSLKPMRKDLSGRLEMQWEVESFKCPECAARMVRHFVDSKNYVPTWELANKLARFFIRLIYERGHHRFAAQSVMPISAVNQS